MKPLHICYLCSEYPPAPHGGIGSFTQTLARSLAKRGHKISILGLYPGRYAGAAAEDGVNVIRISRQGPPLIRIFRNRIKFEKALSDLQAAHPIDILEGGEMDVYLLPKVFPGRAVLRMHGGPTFFHEGHRMREWKERRSFQRATDLCAVSHCVADGTAKLLKLGNRPIEVIHNPIDMRSFSGAQAGVEEQDGLIVFAGVLSERKGIRQLIQAMPRIVAEVPGALLEVYGGDLTDPPPKVPLSLELTQLLSPEVAKRVIWKGRVDRSVLPGAIQRANVCVYPSHIEAMPIAWLEGLASGKAVVASETGPGPELIDDGVTGLLCNPSDPNSIATAIIRVLKDKDLRQRLGTNARQMVKERFELEMIIDKNVEYYRRLAGA